MIWVICDRVCGSLSNRGRISGKGGSPDLTQPGKHNFSRKVIRKVKKQ